jgi:very-short-patch-repair endonuclease
MNALALQVCVLASEQHDVIAAWQLRVRGWSRNAMREGLRGLRRVHQGVCALSDLTELGWFMAAALAMGPTGRISHLSALQLMELRPHRPGDIHVSHAGGGRTQRDGLILHRRTHDERWSYEGIPTVSPTRALQEADLKPYELYRALDIAQERGIQLSLPLDDVVRLQRATHGTTRSEAEARFILLCHDNDLPLPRVNQYLNGFETDFHWPELRLVVEVDGWEHHKERPQFNRDRYRGLVHRQHGWEVVRISADHVYDEPGLVVGALTAAEVPLAA